MNFVPARAPVIALTGFMSCGKSAIGRALAERLRWRFLDLDAVIEQRTRASCQAILSTHGEVVFRRVEALTLRCVLHGLSPSDACVVALGGGTFIDTDTYQFLVSRSVSVWLDCPFAIIWRRVHADARRRAVTRHLNLPALFERRRLAYARADYRVAVTSDDVDAIVLEIVTRLFPDHPSRRCADGHL